MSCSYEMCGDPIKVLQSCKGCKNVVYCSTNCRIQDFYKNHKKVCSGRAGCSPDVSVTSINSNSPLSAYEITNQVLGSGSYGEVKLIKHKKTGEFCALKIIKKSSLEEDKIPIDLVLREISIHTSLSHPNIIKLKESCSDESSIYLLLEYAENGSLFKKIKDNGRLAQSQAKKMFFQAIQAITYLHLNGIVHRDIKPENVLVDSEENIKICDFGWCVKGEESRNTFCGTLDYMAPEMIKGLTHSYEVDVWALGVLLYEMLHGYPPFQGTKESEKCYNIANCDYKFADWISSTAKDLIKQMIKKVPGDRIHLKSALNHQFFLTQENELKITLGDSFRYYIKDYGMDDGVVEEISSDCLVHFKKTGKKMRMDLSEVERRINKSKNIKNSSEEKSESVENSLNKDLKIVIDKKNIGQSSGKKKFFMLEEQFGASFLSANQSSVNSPSSSFSKHFSLNQSIASGKSDKILVNFEKMPGQLGKFPQVHEKRLMDESLLSNLSEKLGKLAESRRADVKEKEVTEPSTGKSVLSESLINISQEESIYHNIGQWIKTPIRRRPVKGKKIEKINEKERSLDKKLNIFKGKFLESASESLAQTPLLSPNNGALTERKLELLDEHLEEQENFKKMDEESELFKKLRSNMHKANEEPFIPFISQVSRESAPRSPCFPIEAIPGIKLIKETESSSEEVNLSKGCRVFDDGEKESFMSKNEEFGRLLSPNSQTKERKKNFNSFSDKKKEKNESFDSWREKIEMNHEEFYEEVEKNLIDEKKSVIKAKEVVENEESEREKRTFTQYDEVLKGYPSVITNFGVNEQTFEKSNGKLKVQKRNLEEMIMNMDKVEKAPIRRPKKQNGFFGWLGKLMGCNERY